MRYLVKKSCRCFFVFFTCFCINADYAQVTVTLSVSQDAAIGYHDGANTAGNNYGTATQNAAFCIPAAADASGVNVNRALIEFSLSTIPGNAIILSAFLNLYSLNPIGTFQGHTGAANASWLQRVIQSWSENTVTWNNQPIATLQNQTILPNSTTYNQDYLNIDVKQLVMDMRANPATGHGFMLRLANESVTNILAFCSKDHPDPALHPKLVITYSVMETVFVQENYFQHNLSVFPEPVDDQMTVLREDGGLPNDIIEIHDNQMRLVFAMETISGQPLKINSSGLENGLYVIDLVREGRPVSRKKLIVLH
jgi:hypothetical protein